MRWRLKSPASRFFTRARRFPLPDRPGQVKLPVWQVNLNRFFFFIWYMKIEEFQNSWSRASDDFEKRRALVYSIVYSWSRSKKTSKLRITGLCEENSPVTNEFPAQRASNAKNVSNWWRHHEIDHRWLCDISLGQIWHLCTKLCGQ